MRIAIIAIIVYPSGIHIPSLCASGPASITIFTLMYIVLDQAIYIVLDQAMSLADIVARYLPPVPRAQTGYGPHPDTVPVLLTFFSRNPLHHAGPSSWCVPMPWVLVIDPWVKHYCHVRRDSWDRYLAAWALVEERAWGPLDLYAEAMEECHFWEGIHSSMSLRLYQMGFADGSRNKFGLYCLGEPP